MFKCLSSLRYCSRFIQQGAAEGQWIFLANCHLLCSWLPKLDKIVDTLQTSEVNKRFRLAHTNMSSNFTISVCVIYSSERLLV